MRGIHELGAEKDFPISLLELWKILAKDTKKTARKDHFYNMPILKITKDIVVLSTLYELSYQGNQVNWNFNNHESAELEKPCVPKEETLDCLIDIYIIYYSLSHYSLLNLPILFSAMSSILTLPKHTMGSVPKHLPQNQSVSGREDLSFKDLDSSSGSDYYSGIGTPASSITSEMVNIDPCLIESGPVHSTTCLIC
ncbi:hypothetical protein DPV78_012706 [Talaromyces pinophilus]|nr:hypothetical protein DPV78_012706 [Talaromyces pinophilus]